MKKTCIHLLLLCAVLLSACTKGPDINNSNSGGENMSTSSNPSAISSQSGNSVPSVTPPSRPIENPDLPKEELEAAKQEFANNLASFTMNNVKEIRIELSPPASQEYQSANQKIIQTWIDLLNKMEIEAVPRRTIYGRGYDVYTVKDVRRICGFSQSYIHTASQRTMIHITNYAKLTDEFKDLLIQMGADPSYA